MPVTSPILGIFSPYAGVMAATSDELLGRVDRLCRSAKTAKALREEILAALRPVVGFDAHVFMLTDPFTRVATSPLADVPMPWSMLPDLIRLRYLTLVNRWDALLDAGTTVSTLLEATAGRPEGSLLWRDVLCGLGVTDMAAMPFGDKHGCWGLLDLWRIGSRPFDAEERAVLSSMSAFVTAGLRRAVSRTFVDAPDAQPAIGPAVVMLAPDLHVRTQTAAAADTLLRLNPPDEPMAPVPAAAYNAAAALVSAEQDVAIGPPWSRVHLGGSRWMTVKADRIGPDDQGGARDIAVSIEPSTPAERTDLFGRSHGLSARETDVLAELATGAATHEIAERLVISEHTVNDHVKSVLAKTGATTRQVLLSRALGAA
jgi:DNA-binding CsgD family transcriptional regulator